MEIREVGSILQEGGRELGLSFSSSQIEDFFIYLRELREWDKRFNLSGIKEEREVITKHFLDSLTCVRLMEDFHSRIIDLGAGAGFPSLPLKIYRPQIRLTLLDSSGKKILFLEHLARILNLKEVRIIRIRIEEFARGEERESFDYAVCRALAKLRVILEYGFPLLKVGGFLIAQKGPKAEKEIGESSRALSILGGKIEQLVQLKLPLSGEKRTLLQIKKARPTPFKYPRRAGIPSKRPL